MDAVHTKIQKIAFFLATAFLLMTPVLGIAQPTFSASTTSVTIGSSSCNDFQVVTLASGSSATPVPFTYAVNYLNGTAAGDANGDWLYAATDNSGRTTTGTALSSTTGATGVALTIGLNRSIGAVTDTAQVILTPTNSPASTPITITVYYAQNTSCGGNTGSSTNNFIIVTPGNVALTAGQGGQQSQAMTIQNVTGSPMTFQATVSPSNSWLSVTFNSTSIAANGTTPITVTANASTLQPGTVNGILTITPQTGFGTSLNIPVSFVVTNGTGGGSGGTNNGTLTVNGATSTTYSTTFSYVAPNLPGSVCIPIQDTAAGANSYTYAVTTGNGGNWLLANFNLSGTTTGFLSPSSNACVTISLASVASSLQSGTYQGAVNLTSISGSNASIGVTLYVSAGAAPGITVSPGLIYTFSNTAVGSTTLQQQVFTISGNPGILLGTAQPTQSPAWFAMTTPTANGNAESFTVTANPQGLIAGVYSTTVTMTSSGTNSGTTTILIVLPVGQAGATNNGGGNTGTTLVAPSSLTFQHQSGSSFWTSGKESQTVTFTGQPATTWSAGIIYGSGGTGWLNIDSPAGASGTFTSSPANIVVDLFNGIGNLTPSSQPYTATVNITTTSGVQSVGVTVLVTPANTPVLLGLPSLQTFGSSNGNTTSSQVIQIVGSDNTSSPTSPPIAAGAPTVSWATATTSGNSLTINVNGAGQSTGVYSGTIPVTASNYPNALNYPVVLIVNGGGSGANTGPLTLSSTSLPFTNVTGNISQTLNITAASSTSVTANATESSCTSQTWLTISPSGAFTASGTNTPMSVTVSPTGINNGTTCNGTITLTTASASQTVSVSMTVGAAGGSGNVTVAPLTMTFAYTQAGTVPPAQTATVVNTSSSTTPIAFTVTTAVSGGVSNWLQTSVPSGQTPFNTPGLSVSVAPGSLGAGNYQGTVTIQPTGGTAQVINVTLNISSSATVTATPTTLPLTYVAGGTSPTATIQVSGGGSAAGFTATAASSSNWLTVTPTSGTTPNSGTFPLTVGISPTVLGTLLPGPYTGTITVQATSPATGNTIVNVNLTVTAPLPTISSVNNSASGATGAVSPGELISLFAPTANPIGPTKPVLLDATTCPSPCTQVPSTMGGVQVVFLPLGIQAPLIYVSAGQINTIVPYEVATAGLSSVSVEVKYLGQTSNAFPLTVTATAPGIFTLNGGVGPAALAQYDAKGNPQGINSPSNPASQGWVLSVYMTGEGVVVPAAKSGSVTVATSTPPFLPQPLSVPTVRINNQPASLGGYGDAAGIVSGVLQVNVIVPAGAGSGAVPLTVSLGSTSAQGNVTAYVQ